MATVPAPNPLLQLTPSQVNKAEPDQWRQAVKYALDDTRCASVAFLTEDMDVDTQTVKVQIAIQERVRTADGPQWWDMPVIIKVPLVLPRGGGYCLTLPLKKGDEGLLIFCDTCFDFWWVNGQDNAPKAANAASASGTQRQNEVRRHHFWDCGFIPGMWSKPHVLDNYSADSMQLRSDDGSTVVDLSADGITMTTSMSVTVNASVGVTVNSEGPVDITSSDVISITGSDVVITPLTGGTF